MTRTRLRLTKADWRAVYDALVWLREWPGGEVIIETTPPTITACVRVLRRIGVDGRAARERGVAPVTRKAR